MLRGSSWWSYLGLGRSETRLPIGFDFDRPIVSESAHVDRSPLVVVTPPERWSVAVCVKFSGASINGDKVSSGAAVVRIWAHVLAGEINWLLVARDGNSILRQTSVAATPKPSLVEVVLEQIDELGELRVANAWNGGASSVQIDKAGVFGLKLPVVSEVLKPPRRLRLQPVFNWSQIYGSRGSTVEEQARAIVYNRLADPHPMRWLNGLRLLIEPGSEVCRAIYVTGLYEPSTMLVLQRLLKPGSVFVDGGAHIGAFTLFAASLVGSSGRVIALEPSPREFASLEANVALNKLTNVTLLREGLSERVEERELLVAEAVHSGHNTLGSRLPYSGVQVAETIQIHTTTLDDLMRTEDLKRTDLVKLDIEGSECNALRGARDLLSSLRPALIVEVNRSALGAAGGSAQELEALLRNAGYCLWHIQDAPDLAPVSSLDALDEVNIVATR